MSEWNGEGIPPVGTVCEATWGGKAEWMKAVILEHDSIPLFAAKLSSEWVVIHRTYVRNAEFRTLQSEEQRQVAEIAEIMQKNNSYQGKAQAVYNAGFRKVEQ